MIFQELTDGIFFRTGPRSEEVVKTGTNVGESIRKG
jgi:hypothetical protein